MTHLFSSKAQYENPEDLISAKDRKLLTYYDAALSDLKLLISSLNIVVFEKTYIDLLQQINIRKYFAFVQVHQFAPYRSCTRTV